MSTVEIPLTANNQQFSIQLGTVSVRMRLIYRDLAGWTIDIGREDGAFAIQGLPLTPEVSLMDPYPQMGLSGRLVVACDNNAPEYPTKTNLGVFARLYFIQE